jgi:hypothetical protein
MRTKARKLERKSRAAELDMEIMWAREANGLPAISPMLGLPPEKWECEFRDYRNAPPPRIASRVGFNLFGDASRDARDPKLRNR